VDSSRVGRITLFRTLAPEELAKVAALASERLVAPGETVATADDFGHSLYAIENGEVDIVQDGTVIQRLTRGDIFGEIALLRSGRRTATAVAATDCTLLTWFKRDVWALERTAPAFTEALRASAEARLARDDAL
jgi:CRP-like cAMP-binding protein